MLTNAKKILIETETRERFTLRISGAERAQAYCERCETIEEMLDLNSAADVSGVSARELVGRVESGDLHSPDHAGGHFLICRASLEQAINTDKHLRPGLLFLKESL